MNVLLKYGRLATLMVLLALPAGCAVTSTFSAYPNKIQPLITSLNQRTPLDLPKSLASERASMDQILYTMEHGRYAQITGATDISMSDFRAAMEKIRTNDDKAVISASAIGANMAATLVNDNAIPYEGEGYERVLLYNYQALNYLKQKDVEGAGVEVRRANAEQEEALRRFEKEIDRARETAERQQVSGSTSYVEQRYAQLDEIAGKVKNSFQNAYTFYLSGFVYELLRQSNDAYIDYKRALEIYPDNRYLQRDVLRLAEKLEMREELAELQQRFPGANRYFGTEKGTGDGELLVLFEDGFVPQKREVKFPVPIGRSGLISIAFPIYQEKRSPEVPLQIFHADTSIGTTELICDVRALAVKALQEKVPAIATRQVIRAVAKGVSAAEARKNLGDLGLFAANVWNLVSENADLRSWLTLPANAQILRATLPGGSYRLSLRHPMVPGSTHADVTIPSGGKTVILVTRTGGQLYTSVTQF